MAGLMKTMRGVFIGSGSDGLQRPLFIKAIFDLVDKPADQCTALYLGTATYDLPGPRAKQTGLLEAAGCAIVDLKLGLGEESGAAAVMPTHGEMEQLVNSADIIVASGGNTLFACDRWRLTGVDGLLREAAARGAVLVGGSAGAICWFTAGHSDSMDPTSYRTAMTTPANAPPSASESTWKYIAIPALDFLRGVLVCPHHDKTQSNGVPRFVDFDKMLVAQQAFVGVGIDHFAALVVKDGNYNVLADAPEPQPETPPSVCLKTVVDGAVESVPLTRGLLGDLLPAVCPKLNEPLLAAARKENPQPAVPAKSRDPMAALNSSVPTSRSPHKRPRLLPSPLDSPPSKEVLEQLV